MDNQECKIAILVGSKSDLSLARETEDLLEKFQLCYITKVISAHKNPVALNDFVKSAREKGYQVIIAMAGLAAHLPGVAASLTTLPVIGVPIPAGALQGVDALLSICQMPAGVPVATMGIGKWGARNAAIMAVEILSLHDFELEQKLIKYRESLASS
ncbi:5-(carboxyamino)imidazole ribonucleotide mutase [bacterium]|nr:5-(carboxyamino)imidazole ribonucleotide mutase [bacterium]